MLTLDIRRFLINVEEDPSDVEEIEKAFSLSLELVQESEIKKVVILVPTLRNMDDTSIAKFLGGDLTKRLLKDRSVPLNEVTLELETMQTFRGPKALSSIVIGVYATGDMFDKLNEIKNAEAIIAIPWLMDEADKWIKTWEPEIID